MARAGRSRCQTGRSFNSTRQGRHLVPGRAAARRLVRHHVQLAGRRWPTGRWPSPASPTRWTRFRPTSPTPTTRASSTRTPRSSSTAFKPVWSAGISPHSLSHRERAGVREFAFRSFDPITSAGGAARRPRFFCCQRSVPRPEYCARQVRCKTQRVGGPQPAVRRCRGIRPSESRR